MRAQTVVAYGTRSVLAQSPTHSVAPGSARRDTGAHLSELPDPRGVRVAPGTRAVCYALCALREGAWITVRVGVRGRPGTPGAISARFLRRVPPGGTPEEEAWRKRAPARCYLRRDSKGPGLRGTARLLRRQRSATRLPDVQTARRVARAAQRGRARGAPARGVPVRFLHCFLQASSCASSSFPPRLPPQVSLLEERVGGSAPGGPGRPLRRPHKTPLLLHNLRRSPAPQRASKWLLSRSSSCLIRPTRSCCARCAPQPRRSCPAFAPSGKSAPAVHGFGRADAGCSAAAARVTAMQFAGHARCAVVARSALLRGRFRTQIAPVRRCCVAATPPAQPSAGCRRAVRGTPALLRPRPLPQSASLTPPAARLHPMALRSLSLPRPLS